MHIFESNLRFQPPDRNAICIEADQQRKYMYAPPPPPPHICTPHFTSMVMIKKTAFPFPLEKWREGSL